MSNPNKNAPDFAGLIKDKFTMRKDIAPVETSATASQAYKVGDKFYYGNLLQEATQDIAQGGTLTLNTNYKNADPVTTSIQNLSTVISKNGAKNFIPLTMSRIRAAENDITSWTQNGKVFTGSKGALTVTITTADGELIEKINISGSTDANSELYFDFARGYNPFTLPNEKAILSGCPAGGRVSTYRIYIKDLNSNIVYNDTGNSIEIPASDSEAIGAIYIGPNQSNLNLDFYPMIRLASDTDPTYEPYAKTNQQLTKETIGLIGNQKVNGAVNMLPNNATTQVINGVTFTVNDDGTVTANGTATANAEFILLRNTDALANGLIEKISNKTVKLNGCPSGGSGSTYHIRKWGQGSTGTYYDTGEGVVFTPSETSLSDTQWNFQIRIMSGTTVSNLTFKPMITVASYNGDYVPYAKSNKELTDNISSILSSLSKLGNFEVVYSKVTNSAQTLSYTFPTSRGLYMIINTGSWVSPRITFRFLNDNYNPAWDTKIDPDNGVTTSGRITDGSLGTWTVTTDNGLRLFMIIKLF